MCILVPTLTAPARFSRTVHVAPTGRLCATTTPAAPDETIKNASHLTEPIED
jgi:hypothetical protein